MRYQVEIYRRLVHDEMLYVVIEATGKEAAMAERRRIQEAYLDDASGEWCPCDGRYEAGDVVVATASPAEAARLHVMEEQGGDSTGRDVSALFADPGWRRAARFYV